MESHISQLETYICHLRTVRNNQTAMSDLPREILAMILVEATHPTPQRKRGWAYFPLSWSRHVELTSVCRLWRSVALDCSRFWTGIPFVPSPRFYPEMLARSKNYPLIVRIDESHLQPDRESAWEFLWNNLPALLDPARLEELHLQVHALFMPELLELDSESQPPFWVSAPQLRWLNISVVPDVESAPNQRRIPYQFLQCSMPALQHLTLVGCRIWWDKISVDCLPKNLLSIDVCQNRMSPYHLHRLLKGSSATLRFLNYTEFDSWSTVMRSLMDPYHPDKEPSTLATPEPLFFPALDKYRFDGTAENCLHFYAWFKASDKVQATIEVVEDDFLGRSSQLDLTRTLFANLGISTQRSTRPHSSLHLCFLGAGDITLKATSEFGRLEIFLPSEWFRSILESVSVQGLREMKIEGFVDSDGYDTGANVPKDVWASFYHNHPLVTRMCVCGKKSRPVLLGLSCPTEIPGSLAAYRTYDNNPKAWKRPDIPNRALPFPLLRTLYVEGVTIGEERLRLPRSHWQSQDGDGATDYIESLLIDRWNYGTPIHRLRLRRFHNIGHSSLDRLQEIAGESHVKWDGMYPNQENYNERDRPVVIEDMDVADFDDPGSSELESE